MLELFRIIYFPKLESPEYNQFNNVNFNYALSTCCLQPCLYTRQCC